MSGLPGQRSARLGGLLIAGSALIAAVALVLVWRLASGFLRNPLVEVVLVGAVALPVFTVLFSLAPDRWSVVPIPDRPPRRAVPDSGSSLMALPAIVGEPSPEANLGPASGIDVLPPIVSPSGPVGVAATGPVNSTLLIPFADPGDSGGSMPVVPTSGLTVTRLVDRMDALQRAAPTSSVPTSSVAAPAPSGTHGSELLLRLTRIPSPPAPSVASAVARRCNDCGDALGSPPHFEPCGDCGRALCERCYWRTSSGPQAHICTTCLQNRAAPRPPTPAVTMGRPTAIVAVSTPSGRALQPRRPVS
jgi:hypothetical protein